MTSSELQAALPTSSHGDLAPSAWVQRWSHLLMPGCSVLDLACGLGRHTQWFARRGHGVTGIDRSEQAIAAVQPWGRGVLADIESGPWPLVIHDAPETFGAVVVTNYLWRPLLPLIQASVAPGGILIYETFADGNASVGKPSRPDFLLQDGELIRAFPELRVIAYEHGFLSAPDKFVQRIVACRPASPPSAAELPTRYPL